VLLTRVNQTIAIAIHKGLLDIGATKLVLVAQLGFNFGAND
jgi:hypothetical protein